jgi:3-isopropylmalate dehydratase small subunit
MELSGSGGGPLGPDVRVPTFFGIAIAFADHLSAADLLPARAAELDAARAATQLFADLDPGLAGRIDRGAVLVAGHRLGHGTGGAASARALAAAGFVAVVAASFADGFDDHSLAAGRPPGEVDAPAKVHTGPRVRMNWEAGTIANLSSGDRQAIRNATEAMLARLRAVVGR